MMYGTDLYRRLAAETGHRPVVARGRLVAARVEPRTLRGAAPAGGLGQDVRPPARADHRRRRPRTRFPLMSTDGVLGARLAADRRLARSVGPRQRARRGRAPAWRADPPAHEGRRDRHGPRPRHRRDRRAQRRAHRDRAPTSSSTPAGCSRRRSAGWSASTVPIIPMAHQYLFTEPIEGVHPGLPQLRDPDNLVYFREEVGGLCMGGYERDPAPWSLDGIPPDFNGKLLAPDMAALRVDHGGRHPARPGDGRRRRQPGHQRPRGLHARQRVHPRRIGGPRLLRRGRVLGARDRRRGRDRAPDGVVDRRRRARARPVEDGHPAVRAGLPQPGLHARAVDRELRDLLRHPLPERGAAGRATAADCRRPTRSSRDLGAAFGEKSGWERPNWFESNAAAGDESLRPRGWAGMHWSPGDRRRGAGDAAGGRPLRRDVVRQARGRRAGRHGVPRADVRERRGPAGRLDRLHPAAEPPRRDRGRPDGDADGAGGIPDRHRHGLRQPRRGVAAEAPARTTARSRCAT